MLQSTTFSSSTDTQKFDTMASGASPASLVSVACQLVATAATAGRGVMSSSSRSDLFHPHGDRARFIPPPLPEFGPVQKISLPGDLPIIIKIHYRSSKVVLTLLPSLPLNRTVYTVCSRPILSHFFSVSEVAIAACGLGRLDTLVD